MNSRWRTLPEQWRAAFESAMRSYLHYDSVPVGAVITGADGRVIATGCNNLASARLAHAEIDACNACPPGVDRRSCDIWVTVEPCPMCTGAIRMMQLRRVHYAARDPAAGSLRLLTATEFMRELPCSVAAPQIPELEFVVVALIAEYRERTEHRRWRAHWQNYHPEATSVGRTLARSGVFHAWKQAQAAPETVFGEVLGHAGA